MKNTSIIELQADVAQLSYELGLKENESTSLRQDLARLQVEISRLRDENRGLQSELDHLNELPMSPISLRSENDQIAADKSRMIQERLQREVLALKNENNILSSWIKDLIS
ncbi:unnamed protein product [Kluyveromyces dobzhanskii CBS 2104]|uniref:WGS project CCBQ000000000 data, contig 00098 n=1 Tax=Kluyveromyces dobzhanskii CBS 2104 TaxID=1427455 RepID=A0A0A8L5R8_9SACH|nr:unnamed protein product [Kluyveromyces dobzhanskii CBS 2104]